MAEEARLESVYTPKAYPEFESRSLRNEHVGSHQPTFPAANVFFFYATTLTTRKLWLTKHPRPFIGLSDMIEMLFVHPDFMGKGIGKSLLTYAIRQKGMTKVDVNEQNDKAVKFYISNGFVVTGRSELDSDGRPFPILHMSLPDK